MSRPNEGRKRVCWYILPSCEKAVRRLINRMNPEMNSSGKVVESRFSEHMKRVGSANAKGAKP